MVCNSSNYRPSGRDRGSDGTRRRDYVKLGNWGSFSVTLSSLGVPTKEEVNAKNIKSVNLNFQPDEAFKTDLQKATFAWVDKLAEGRPGGSGGSDSESPDEI